MPRLERKELLSRFREMVRKGIPIMGGGAGTGISAKCEEAGGIDLIVIYNSGRYRMAGRASSAGLLAYGNANEIVKEMALEVLPVVSGRFWPSIARHWSNGGNWPAAQATTDVATQERR